ncbi:MAG: hypothetical protein GVY19_09605 [Bacteroidetes bacterium]|jgi:hypothetical protein|nr:hypothetical protein [Bacteroidota bacterium]
MYHTRIFIFIGFVLFVFTSSCKKSENPQVENPLWSSTDPFTIPTKNRVQKFLRGNMVENPSFEQGKRFPIDTASHFYVDNWQKVGDQVQWVDITKDSIYKANEASHEKRAIKISRTSADETVKTGEGVLSNYIKVIPGNYRLTFDLKLQNIKPYSSRLGTKLYDAIDIQVKFYDKTKNAISGELYSAVLNKEVDYSIKNYPFSNYEQIDEMDWTRIRGRSFEPLIMEGIIPNDAQYVRIFFGLKGTGTMWVDNVDYRYTENNLSLLERIDIYKDTIPSPYNLIIPKPKHIIPADTINYLSKWHQRPNDIIILIPENSHHTEKRIAQKLKSRLTVLHDSLPTVPEITITPHLAAGQTNNHPLIISLGNTNLFNRYRELLPVDSIKGHKQGYFIHSNPGLKHIIFVGSNSREGIHYAVNTLTQLIDKNATRIYNAHVIDYPSFQKRGLLIGNMEPAQMNKLMKHVNLLSQYNFNHVIFDQEKSILENGYTFEESIQKFIRSHNGSLLSTSVLINPFLEDKLINPYDTNYSCYDFITYPNNLNATLNKYVNPAIDEYYISFGESNYHLLKDCINENINTWNFLDVVRNHKKIIHAIDTRVKRFNPSVKVSYIPLGLQEESYFSSQAELSIYYDQIFEDIDEHSQFIWAGHNTYSPVVDYAAFYRFSDYFSPYPHVIYTDVQTEYMMNEIESANSIFVGNKRLYSLFTPCQLDYFMPLSRNTAGAISFGLNIYSAIDVIRYLSYADFAWNKEDYNPTEAIWRILISLYGIENTKELILFNDAFVTMLEIINTPINKTTATKLKKAGVTVVNNLEIHYQKLSESKQMNEDLLVEIKMKMDELLHVYNRKMDNLTVSKASVDTQLIK